MIRREVKLKLTRKQEATLDEWLWHLTAVYNWGVRRIEMDAANNIYHTQQGFLNLLAGTSARLGIPGHVIQGTLLQSYVAWQRCFRKLARKPRLKGRRNRLNSIHFPDRVKIPEPGIIKLLGFPKGLRYKQQHAQAKHDPSRGCMIAALPQGSLRGCRLIKRASGWYASIVVDIEPSAVAARGEGSVGIDPGYKSLLTLSTGEKIDCGLDIQGAETRQAQAQRGKRKKLAARLQERLRNQRKDQNHKLSRRLVAENETICFSKDNLRGLSRAGFGKSVARSGHGELRSMIAYKSLCGGRRFIEVPSAKSTITCSRCGCSTGPRGKAGLKVRQWECSACGAHHDRDVNAAANTLIAGAGQALRTYA